MITISTKTKGILVASGLLVSFALGRYSVSKPDTKETKNVEETFQKQVDEQAHTQTVIVYSKDSKGQPIETETITNDTTTKIKDVDKTDTQETVTVTPPKNNLWTVSGMAGVSPLTNFVPVYGVHVTKEVLGPISVGAFGFTNGLVGISVGVTF